MWVTYDVKLRKPKCATTVSSALEGTALDLNPGPGTYRLVLPVGPTGPRGPVGSIGPDGVAGPIGPRGLTGIQGIPGAAGAVAKVQSLAIVYTPVVEFKRETPTGYLTVIPGKYCITVNCSFYQTIPSATDGILEYWLNVLSADNISSRIDIVRQIVHVKTDFVRPTPYEAFTPYLTLVSTTLPYLTNTYFVDIVSTSQVSFVCQMLADIWVPAGRAGFTLTDLNMGGGSINVYKLS